MQDTVEARSVETKPRVFIAYSRKDMAFADKLEAALTARGFAVLIDRNDIYAFDHWERIQALIGGADTVVVVLSPDAVNSDVALKEVAYAGSLHKRLAPIVYRRVEDGAVPEALRRLNFIFLDDPAHFDESADRLAETLRTDIGWVRQHIEYGEAERCWSAAGRPPGLLLHSPTLEVAEYWIGSRPAGTPEPTEQIRAFVAASRTAEVAVRRRKHILNTVLYTVLICIILVLVGWINQNFLIAQWRYVTVTLPYRNAHVRGHVLTAAKEQALKPGDSFKECAQDCPEMVLVPAASFLMGAPQTESQAYGYGDEIPQHTVTIAKPFAVSKYDVTFADWDACLAGGGCNGHRPDDHGWGRGQQPVIDVNWADAQQYVAWLSLVTGKTYRLLSEAEYEYAIRAGTTTPYWWGDESGKNNAACNGCGSKWDGQQPAPVGSFAPNKFGLYDMVGEVVSWAEDCFHPNYNGAPRDGSAWLEANDGDCSMRILRGSSWSGAPEFLRSGLRSWNPSGNLGIIFGFRVARTLHAT